jgi:hypothetical protein
MAMGTREDEQPPLWIATSDLPTAPGHPFYARLNTVLDAAGFDRFVEAACQRFYAPVRLRQWKLELQRFADGAGLAIVVCHFPPGTSKWNKVEHRLFSFISSNWRGEPLRDYETIVRLIANTTTAKGLTVTCRLDRRRYPVGRKVSDKEMATLHLTPQRFHGEWNYVISPRTP